ncbi:MAG: sodium:proton antiporter [Bacteroidota bacterium]|nr:sodium:proton antiporter [Bacteroidota bacterium]
MTFTIIITLCGLLLVAYFFDVTSSVTRIPSVLLLLLLGWLVREVSRLMQITVPDLSPLLPFLGTVGLVLIVLEGALELEFNHSKKKVILKSFFSALVPMVILSILLAFAFQYAGHVSFKEALNNAIPFCVISSTVAISSAGNLGGGDREFVIYESSFSDILGVLFFNFITQNEIINLNTAGRFSFQMVLITAISFVATLGLSYLLSKISHHIKFMPIILLAILIYAISEVYHLPALVFILLFGLFLGNLDELKQVRWIQLLRPRELDKEVKKFKELIGELTFLIRALFFLLFGYLMKRSEILNPETIIWACGITVGIFLIRALFLKLMRMPLSALLFVAPRGLINILLFLALVPGPTLPFINSSLVTQVIILSVLVMMIGVIQKRGRKPDVPPTANEEIHWSTSPDSEAN